MNFQPGSDGAKPSLLPVISQISNLKSQISPGPVVRILALAQRCRESFPECRLSWGSVIDRALAQIGLQRKWSGEVRAIDDPLEQSDVIDRMEELAEVATRNDPSAVRRKIRRTLAEFRAQSAEVHARTERAAAAITPDMAPN